MVKLKSFSLKKLKIFKEASNQTFILHLYVCKESAETLLNSNFQLIYCIIEPIICYVIKIYINKL